MAYQPKSYRKFIAGSVSAAVVASAVAVPVSAAAAGFPDVPKGHWAHAEITALVNQGVITGYPDGSFKPSTLLNRGQAATLFTRALDLEIPENLNVFKDLKATSNFAQYAAAVEKAGIFGGYANGNFGAGDLLTREQMATALVKAFGLKDNGTAVDLKDLDKVNVSHRENVKVLAQHGITTGDQNGNFNPKGQVSRAHFATFLHRALVNAGKLAENPAVESVKAINATTVEVSFKEAVKVGDLGTFTIEDKDGKELKVENAVAKQTNSKVVVLTTATQTGDATYTVKLGSDKIGTFKGVSAVVPSKVAVVERSIQGVTGKEVTVKAQVTVAEGQSKAGIPVTFYVGASGNGLNEPITAEAVTNDDGVATYTYTRYVAATESVTVYATGDRAKFSTGSVYWGVAPQLTITEVNEGSSITNGANKTYKIKLVNTNGSALSNNTVKVALAENIDIKANEGSSATVNGVTPVQYDGTSSPRVATVQTDTNGEALITVSGSNTSATPIVFINTVDDYYSATALQAKASKVTFGALQSEYVLTMVGANTDKAAEGYANARKYTVTVTDKDGKPVANETVKLALNELIDNVIGTHSNAEFVTFNANGSVNTTSTTGSAKTNAKGEAVFYLGINAGTTTFTYGTPFAWIDINNSNANSSNTFEKGEPSVLGQTTFFEAAVLKSAKVTSYLASGTTEEDEFSSSEIARFDFKLTNQSGKAFASYAAAGVASIQSTFTVNNTGSNDVIVFSSLGDAQTYIATPNATNEAEGVTVTPSRNATITVTDTTNASVYVVSKASTRSTNVSVTASAVATKSSTGNPKQTLVVTEAAKASFTASNEVSQLHTGVIASYNTTDRTITFATKDPVKYAGETGKTYVFKGLGGTPIATAGAFLAELARGEVTATYEVKDNVVTFYIVGIDPNGTLASDSAAINTALTNAKAAATTANGNSNNYTSATFTTYTTALTTANALPETTDAEKVAKTTAINNALAGLKSAVDVTINGLVFTFSPAIAGATVTVDTALAATATTDADSSITSVTVTGGNTVVVAGTVDAADVVTATVTVNGVAVTVALTSADNGVTWTANPASPIHAR